MGIYITEKQKLEWEIEIYELKTKLHQLPSFQVVGKNLLITQIEIYENLIAKSKVLPDSKTEPLMSAAEFVAKTKVNVEECIAGDIFVIMADYAKYVLTERAKNPNSLTVNDIKNSY